MARDRAFENQFQWEVDRWVFRHRHRGEPIEVTLEERDRLIELHRRRKAFGSKLLARAFVCAFVIAFIFPRQAYLAAIVIYAGIIVGMPLLQHWAYDSVTADMRGRPLLGLPLGPMGRLARISNPLRWRQLLIGLVWLMVIAALEIPQLNTPYYGSHPMAALVVYAFMGAGGILVVLLIALKWAQHERTRLRREKVDNVRRARELRLD